MVPPSWSYILKEIGGVPLVSYYPTSRVVVQNHPAKGESGDRWHAAWAEVVPEFLSNGEYKLHSLGRGSYELEATDPFVDATLKLRTRAKKSQALEILRRQFVNRRIDRHMMELERDLSAAQQLKGTLGSAIATHEKVLGRLSGTESANVLFNISLPSLEHLPIRELIALRAQEGDAFAAFRQALSRAALELFSTSSNARPQQLAVQLVRDFIDPEISKIDSRLRSARRALSRKVAVSLPIAAVSAVCGLHLGINPVAAGAAGLLLTGAQNAAAKYFEEKQAVEMSDMFFLWKALKHAE